ncbi:hypothetical protein WR25_02965 isoform B [Diploscapter pachys]|uniref:T-complex protein 1 subunit theta n=1 Tax=Diploscapter pachys TaxID=2018661 RepID=A0A2A2K3G1_9BILA|nr:hypothetical protein WR25_02965 isoform A [Diploscapter pachys]PAV68507.1 hypothetical protein WR25_02965 isoform B [Diploscapter pachys]
MAMAIPKSGLSRFMKEGAQAFKGVDEAVQRNIDAVVELAGQLRAAYGPNGLNKMVINHIEKLFVTNDAATILKELEIQHPAAKLIIMASEQQEKQVGDNTNTVIIFAAALLENAAQLINLGLSPQEIAIGYETAAEKAISILDSLVVKEATDLKNLDEVRKYLRSAITSKQYANEDVIADLVARACVQTCPANSFNFNVDNIRICKIIGGGVGQSIIMNGMVFKRGAEGEVKSAKDARLAIYTCPFDLTQTETKGTVLIENADELMNFSKGEEQEVEKQVKEIADAGVKVVVAAGKFGDLYLHFLNKYKIMGVRLTSKFDLRRLCRATGAQAQARICAPPVNLLGHCDLVEVKEIGDENVVVFDKQSEKGHVATIIIRGSSQSRIDDVERAVDDAINTYKALTKCPKLLAGGGAVEIELSRQIEQFGKKCEGLDQYSIKKFAYSLETLPKCLAENCGMNPTDALTTLMAAHEKGQKNAGINIMTHGLMDAVEANIFDLHAGKKSAIVLAVDAATTVLRVDQIIMAKPAGGPKPRGPKPQDEDDEGMAQMNFDAEVNAILAKDADHKVQLETLIGLLYRFLPSPYIPDKVDLASALQLTEKVVTLETGSMVVSRQYVAALAERLEQSDMPLEVVREVTEKVIDFILPRAISYEDQTCVLKLQLASVLERQNDVLGAARALMSINADSGQRYSGPTAQAEGTKMQLYLRIAKLLMDGGETDLAEEYVNRASLQQTENKNDSVAIELKALNARVMDAKRRFIDAAQRYYEISQVNNLHNLEIANLLFMEV